MPTTTPKMHRTMEAAKHDPAFAKKMGIPQKVASEFVAADEKKERKQGKSEMAAPKPMPSKIIKTPSHGYGR